MRWADYRRARLLATGPLSATVESLRHKGMAARWAIVPLTMFGMVWQTGQMTVALVGCLVGCLIKAILAVPIHLFLLLDIFFIDLWACYKVLRGSDEKTDR